MALTMLDKKAAAQDRGEWPVELKAEFERESRQNNGCVGSELLSETDKVRVWIIRLAPGERIGFHRHVLNYFWTSVNGGRGRQHLMDGTTGCATMPAPRTDSSLSTRSYMSTAKPRARSCRPANRPLIEPPITTARFPRSVGAAPGMLYIVPTSVGGMPWL